MRREVCTNCGGVLVAESIGWRCKNCRGFISLQDGKFYEYIEKPFMSPQTNADRIRAMSDEELAEVLGKLVHCGGCPMRENCKVDDLPCNNVMLEWLKQPAE